MQYALEVNNISKRYPLFTLDNVTMRVRRGTIMGMIGENGAGKTTTLKLLLGLIQADGGDVALLGETTPGAMQRAKTRVGVVLDEGFFPDVFTPGEINKVCRGLFPNWDSEQFQAFLRRFSLPNKKIKELSKGMKTKLAIGVALAHHPELLVLDEATGGLDPVVRSEILDIFLDFIQDENHAILFSTHITADLERVADEITFLHKGKVMLQREKDDILENYGVLKCGKDLFDALDKTQIVGYRKGAYGFDVLMQDRNAYMRRHPDAVVDPATLDNIMLYTIKGGQEK